MSEGAGSTYVADGITARPTYGFAPPTSFLHSDTPPTQVAVFDIRSFGAVESAGHDNLPAIQAAIRAANAAGGGVVTIPQGVWGVGISSDGYGSIHLMDNVFLQGAGMGLSTIRLMDGTAGTVTGIVRTPWGEGTTNCGVADLTIDGNRAGTTGQVDGFFCGPQPGSPIRDSDIYVLRVEIKEVSRYAFDPHEQTERLAIRDCVAHDNTFDGFVLDYIIDSEITGNVAYANGRHGFNIVTQSHDILLRDNVAHDNGSSGFVVQRGSENIPPSHSITILGGASYANGRHGVLLQMTHDVVVSGIDVHGNGMAGIRLHGASNVTVTGSQIHDNSRSSHDGYSEIEIVVYDDTVYGHTFEANANLVSGNTIESDGPVSARYGVEERPGGTSGNVVENNTFSGTVRGAMALAGDGTFTLILGTGNADTLSGGSARDSVVGGAGDDNLSGLDGADILTSGEGADSLSGGADNDVLTGGAGNDHLGGGSGRDVMAGGSGNDTLDGDTDGDTLDGGDGSDLIDGGSGDDMLLVDPGNDVLVGGAGIDTLDFMDGWSTGPLALPASSAPCLYGSGAGVLVDLDADTSIGRGTDIVMSVEVVIGTAWADTLLGDHGAEDLRGGAGNDVLRGLDGADTLVGGAGKDGFVWGAASDVISGGVHQGIDTIVDFELGRDVLDLRGLTAGRSKTTLDDLVRATDGTAGTTVAFNIAGSFQDVALLDGVHGVNAYGLSIAGALLL